MRPADAPPPLLAAHGMICPRGGPAGFGPVDLELHAGRLLHLRGANGSGKTSLLRMLAGLLRPLAGELLWRAAPVRRDPAAYFAGMAYLGHGNGLNGALSAREHLRCALALAGTPRAEADIGAALARWRLDGCADASAARLSQGQGRRLALAAVALGGKPLWLLDEPDAGLDAASLDLLREALRVHLAAGGGAVVASHRQTAELVQADIASTLDMDGYAHAGDVAAVGTT